MRHAELEALARPNAACRCPAVASKPSTWPESWPVRQRVPETGGAVVCIGRAVVGAAVGFLDAAEAGADGAMADGPLGAGPGEGPPHTAYRTCVRRSTERPGGGSC